MANVYASKLPLVEPDLARNREYRTLMHWADGLRRLRVRANADTAEDATRARAFGAEGIGLFRTEHMFYGEGSDAPLEKLRRMIVTAGEQGSGARRSTSYSSTSKRISARRSP